MFGKCPMADRYFKLCMCTAVPFPCLKSYNSMLQNTNIYIKKSANHKGSSGVYTVLLYILNTPVTVMPMATRTLKVTQW